MFKKRVEFKFSLKSMKHDRKHIENIVVFTQLYYTDDLKMNVPWSHKQYSFIFSFKSKEEFLA